MYKLGQTYVYIPMHPLSDAEFNAVAKGTAEQLRELCVSRLPEGYQGEIVFEEGSLKGWLTLAVVAVPSVLASLDAYPGAKKGLSELLQDLQVAKDAAVDTLKDAEKYLKEQTGHLATGEIKTRTTTRGINRLENTTRDLKFLNEQSHDRGKSYYEQRKQLAVDNLLALSRHIEVEEIRQFLPLAEFPDIPQTPEEFEAVRREKASKTKRRTASKPRRPREKPKHRYRITFET